MLKRLFVSILLLTVALSACVVSAQYFLKPFFKEKILTKAEELLGEGIELSELDISLLRGIMAFKDFGIKDSKIIKYYNTASAGRIVFDIDLPRSFFQKSLIFDKIYLKDFVFSIKSIKRESAANASLGAHEDNAFQKSPQTSAVSLNSLAVKQLLIEDSKFIFQDYSVTPSPSIIEITRINGNMEDLRVPLQEGGLLRGAVYLKGELSPENEGFLEVDGIFAKNGDEIDFDLKAKIKNVNLIKFSPYYSNTSFSILKEARLDIDSKAGCLRNQINATQNARLYDIKLHDTELTDEDKLFGLPARTVINFFKDLKGDVRFSFNIGGTLDDPQFDFCPVVRGFLSNALRDKIISKFRDLPREVIKMGEKALNGDLDIKEKMEIVEEEIGKKIGDIKKEFKKIIDYKP